MANHGGVHGKLLEVTVVGCNKLKDTTWFLRQDPYVCIEYGGTRNRTRVCTDGGKNPTFQEKFVYNMIEGLRELNISVWNSNTISRDDFIGGARVNLAKILSQGYDDSSWPLHTKNGWYAGEIQLIMHYSDTNANNYMPPYVTASAPLLSMYSTPTPPPPSSTFYTSVVAGGYHMSSSYSSYPHYPQPYDFHHYFSW